MSMSHDSSVVNGGASTIRGGAKAGAQGLVAGLRDAFETGRTRPLAWRLKQLEGLGRMLTERESEIKDALYADLGKPELESFLAEVAFTAGEVDYIRRRLAKWMKPERVLTPLAAQPGSSKIHREPLGTVLIIAPWNYPFQLAIGPLIGALAAGNCVVLKPSEVASATSALIARFLPDYVDASCVKVVEGGVSETTDLLAERFDHIFYTGNGAVGRIVMEAAAKHLTPVTLELGGKSPCLVDRDTDLEVTARRIVWGKFFNAGQTCVAPDYVLAHEAIVGPLLAQMKQTLREFYGSDPRSSSDFGRIVNARHHQRLMKLMGSGEIVAGGESSEADRYIAPTILKGVDPSSPVMADEIFGPILPVLSVRDMGEAIRFVNARPKPLALYVFSTNESVQERVIAETSSGGASVNHVWMHLGVPGLPFGGVGPSGMGAYHGKATFETFSHRKSVLKKPSRLDPPIMYPPYSDTKMKWIRRLI